MNYYKIILNLIVFFCLSNNVSAQSYSQALLDSANAGYASAQNKLGYMYEKGEGVTKDYAEALKWFRKAAEQGNAKAQYNLGVMYINGEGVTQDYAEALKWFRKAAEQGDAGAQYNLGFMYLMGNGVTKDYAEALKWFRKAAEQGDADGQNKLGVMYEYGKGVTQDYAEALKWYRKAAEQGNAYGQNNLGVMYENGKGVTQDYAEALKWFRKAAEQGNAKAQNVLGLMYIKGEGVTKDPAEALKWFRMAAEQGNEQAQNYLDSMKKNGQGKTFKTDDGNQEVSTIIKEGEFILGGWLPEHFKYKLYSLSGNEVDCKIFYQENLFAEYRLNIPSSDIEQFTPIMSCSYMEKSSELFKAGKQILDNSIEHRIFDFILEWGSSFLEKAERLGMKKAVIPIADYLYSRDHSGDWIKAYHLYKKVSDTEKDGYSTYMAYLCFKDKGFDLVDDISTLPKERMRLLNLAISRGSKAAVQEKARVLKEEKQAKINSAKAQAENKKKAEYNRKHPTYRAKCEYCWGLGKHPLNLSQMCYFCNGRGWVIKRR